jgi:glyoxylase-like metal-dependent hydrolase (beta-lactamase superfamily II)
VAAAQLERGPAPDRFAVYAVQFARRTGVRAQHLSGHDDRSAEPQDTSYFVWLALSSTTTVLVDAGIDPATPVPFTGFHFRDCPVAVLQRVGIQPGDVDHVVLTHLHYDHTGCARRFTDARYVIQRAELDYWNGPAAARNKREAWLGNSADVDHLRRPEIVGRVDLIDGDHEVTPGVSAHLVGGHTAGLQVVRVRTSSDPVVIASDACHFYENLIEDRPSPIVHNTPDVYAAFDRVRELAGPDGVVLPGHDPAVLTRFTPAVDPWVVQAR